MIHRVRNLVTALAIGLPALAAADRAPPPPPPPPVKPQVKPPAEDPVSTYLKQDEYTYCDLKLLANLWKTSVEDSKARLGTKLQAKNTMAIESDLGAARTLAFKQKSVQCHYHDGGFNYNDAEKLAARWKISVEKAKARIADKLMMGGNVLLREQLATAGRTPQQQKEIGYFLKQKQFTYCDAKMLSGLWKQSIDQAKAFIGMKVNIKSIPALEASLKDARAFAKKTPAAQCSYIDAFSFDETVKLSKLWGKSLPDTKTKITAEILEGREVAIRGQLKGPARMVPPPIKPPPPPPPTKKP